MGTAFHPHRRDLPTHSPCKPVSRVEDDNRRSRLLHARYRCRNSRTTLLPARPAIMRHLMCAITSTQSLVSARMGRMKNGCRRNSIRQPKLIRINFEICNRFAFSFSSALVSRSIKRIRITDGDRKIYVTAAGTYR